MKRYEIHEIMNGQFGVYEVTNTYFILVKSFKSRKSAENWVARHA